MTTQPEAMRLSDALEMSTNHGIRREAAAELRRLHAENERLHDQIAACEPYLKEGETPAERIERDHKDSLALMTLLAREKTKNDALLEALKAAEPYLRHADVAYNVYVQARAAIAKAEENT